MVLPLSDLGGPFLPQHSVERPCSRSGGRQTGAPASWVLLMDISQTLVDYSLTFLFQLQLFQEVSKLFPAKTCVDPQSHF